MNITIAKRTKIYSCTEAKAQLHQENAEDHTLQPNQNSQQQQTLKDADQTQSSNLTAWFMRKCFAKHNSIFDGEPQETFNQPSQIPFPQDLAAKKVQQDTVSTSQKSKINLLSAKCKSLSRPKDIKIKLETHRESNKMQKVVFTKAFQGGKSSKLSIKANLSTRSNMSNQNSRDNLDQNRESAPLFKNKPIQMRFAQREAQNKTITKSHHSRDILQYKESFSIGSKSAESCCVNRRQIQSAIKLEDYIYQPIFTIGNHKSSSENTPNKTAIISDIDSQQSFVLSKGLQQIFGLQITKIQRKQWTCYQKHKKSMFIIEQKMDEALENQ